MFRGCGKKNAVPVIDYLLNDHPIPFDDALVRNDGG
jgi:hypothetical protein